MSPAILSYDGINFTNILYQIKIYVNNDIIWRAPWNIFTLPVAFKMKFLILSVWSLVSGEPRQFSAAFNPTLASVPEKLRLYQNATGMSDESLLAIFKRSLEG